jgi:hypothetical protein
MPFRVQQLRRDGCSTSTTGRRPRQYERIRTERPTQRRADSGSTIGCINLSGPLAGPSNNINLAESVRRVIAVIEDLRAYAGAKFPTHLETKIPAAWLIIED